MQNKYSIIDAIKSNITTVEAARIYLGVALTKRSNRWLAKCPLHREKTPSFYIFPDDRFKCFGCQEHGDVIDLVSKGLHIDTGSAIKVLARDLGIRINHRISLSKANKKITKKKHPYKLAAKLNDKLKLANIQVCALMRTVESVIKSISTEDDLQRPEVEKAFHLRVWLEYLAEELLHEDAERQIAALLYVIKLVSS